MINKNFTLSFPTDSGFWGRRCKECKKYFKIEADKIKSELHCPYCGKLQANDELWTKKQTEQTSDIITSNATYYIANELEKILKKSSKNTTLKYKSSKKLLPKTNVPHHVEKQIDTEIECLTCNLKFQIYGIFGYCPICKEETFLLYDTNLEIIIKEINSTNNKTRLLRHAYNDTVSTFEGYCKLIATKYGLDHTHTNFQNLQSVKKLFKKDGLDIYSDINNSEKITIKKIFEKRHAYQHSQGQINEKYIQNIPQDIHLLDTKAELSILELTEGIKVLKTILRVITNKYSY